MPSPTLQRCVVPVLMILCFVLGLLALRLHLISGDVPLLALAALAGLASIGLGTAMVFNNRVQVLGDTQ
ncbi:MAG: hypothetical protein AAGH88_05300 [Planctomycetota bacterium]